MTDTPGGAIRRLNSPELGAPPGYSQIVEVRAGRMIFIAGETDKIVHPNTGKRIARLDERRARAQAAVAACKTKMAETV